MKKISIILFTLLLFLTPINTLAADDDLKAVTANNFIVADQNTGEILLGKNADEKVPIASTVKIITIYRTLEAIREGKLSWEQKTEMPQNLIELSQNTFLGNVEFRSGEKYSVRDLVNATILISSNSAAIRLAELVSGSNEAFVVETRQWLKDIGLEGFSFVSPSGLELVALQDFGLAPSDAPKALEEEIGSATPGTYNLFSAYDVAVIAFRLVHDFPEILEIANQGGAQLSNGEEIRTLNAFFEYEDENSVWHNGLKTGFTPFSQSSYVGYAKKDGREVILSVLRTNQYIFDVLELSALAFTPVADGKNTGSNQTKLVNQLPHQTQDSTQSTSEEPNTQTQASQENQEEDHPHQEEPNFYMIGAIVAAIGILLGSMFFKMKKAKK